MDTPKDRRLIIKRQIEGELTVAIAMQARPHELSVLRTRLEKAERACRRLKREIEQMPL